MISPKWSGKSEQKREVFWSYLVIEQGFLKVSLGVLRNFPEKLECQIYFNDLLCQLHYKIDKHVQDIPRRNKKGRILSFLIENEF